MFRIMSIATLVMIAVCFFIGAGLAFADEGKAEPGVTEQINDASRPVETVTEENLAQNDRDRDAYDFSDYVQQPDTSSATPPVDAEAIEEPDLYQAKQQEC